MKTSNFIKLFAIMIIFAISFTDAQAQKKTKKQSVPVKSISLGAQVGPTQQFGGIFGYALQENLHVGSHFAVSFDSNYDEEDAITNFVIAPYAKWFFMKPVRNLRPFFKAQFNLENVAALQGSYGVISYKSETSTSLSIDMGAEWFPYTSVGIYAGFRVFNFQFDPSRFVIGMEKTFIGIEWFID